MKTKLLADGTVAFIAIARRCCTISVPTDNQLEIYIYWKYEILLYISHSFYTTGSLQKSNQDFFKTFYIKTKN